MIKKIFSSFLLSFAMIAFIGPINVSEPSNQNKAAVLNWGTFTESMRENVGELDCKDKGIQKYLKNTQLREELFENGEEGLKMDVKGCYMEKNVDKYATWFIFLALAVTVGFLILQGVKTITGGDSGGGGGGGMPGGMPGGGGGGGGDPMNAFKPALIGIILLTFVLVGGLNTIILLAMFFIDLFN